MAIGSVEFISGRTLMEYDGSNRLLYSGKNNQESGIANLTWRINKFFYDGGGNLVDVQILTGAWTGRASLAWKSQGGD